MNETYLRSFAQDPVRSGSLKKEEEMLVTFLKVKKWSNERNLPSFVCSRSRSFGFTKKRRRNVSYVPESKEMEQRTKLTFVRLLKIPFIRLVSSFGFAKKRRRNVSYVPE